MLPKTLVLLASAALVVTLCPPVKAQLKLPRVSPGASVTQTIGMTDLTVTYSRPGVKSRVIWGQLVPYGQVWRAGANEATTFVTSDPIQFGGKPLAAGTYELFMLPGKSEWQVIVNSAQGQWGAFSYDSTRNLLRIAVKPEIVGPEQEWMEFSFEDMTPGTLTAGPNSTNLVLRWEKLRIAVPIVVDVNGIALAKARDAVAAAKADDWRTPYQAAGFCLANGVGLEEGKQWLEKSLGVQETYSNLGLKARWQASKNVAARF